MNKKRFSKPKDKTFRKVVLLSRFKERAQAEAAAARLIQEGIPANISEESVSETGEDLPAGPFLLWVWEESKKQALQLLQ